MHLTFVFYVEMMVISDLGDCISYSVVGGWVRCWGWQWDVTVACLIDIFCFL